jgi:hypothetical protein
LTLELDGGNKHLKIVFYLRNSDKMIRDTNTFTHRHKGVDYVLHNTSFEKPVVLGRLVEYLVNEPPKNKKLKNVVKLGLGTPPKGSYARFDENVSEEVKEEILKRWEK